MDGFQLLKGAVVAVAAAGMVLPQQLQAAGPKVPAKQTAHAAAPQDIVLAQGTLTGRVVDASGVAIDGAQVVVRQGNTEVAKTVTDKAGTFTVGELRGGVYQITAGQSEGVYRLWNEKSAPPAATEQVLLVQRQGAVRGQFLEGMNGAGYAMAGLGIAGLTTGIVGITQANQANNKAKQALAIAQQPKSN